MKTICMAAVAGLLTLTGCISEPTTPVPLAPQTEATVAAGPQKLTSILWLDSVKNMGTVFEGQKVEVVFRFRNTGTNPLIIASATPSCGCTVPSKPEKPIMSGQEGEIKAVFDSQGRTGTNHKSISVQANTENTTVHSLIFDVQVIGKADGPKPVENTTQKF
ncbi:MAG: DUF1573 domain-containing protein [Bacteroidetes bacterium]|nr:MAG: DUF1573 domain-containing protein [Bacteroidota bacterium]